MLHWNRVKLRGLRQRWRRVCCNVSRWVSWRPERSSRWPGAGCRDPDRNCLLWTSFWCCNRLWPPPCQCAWAGNAWLPWKCTRYDVTKKREWRAVPIYRNQSDKSNKWILISLKTTFWYLGERVHLLQEVSHHRGGVPRNWYWRRPAGWSNRWQCPNRAPPAARTCSSSPAMWHCTGWTYRETIGS